MQKKSKRFLKECKRCQKTFRPTGRNHRVCYDCQHKARMKNLAFLEEGRKKKMKELSLLIKFRELRKQGVKL